MDFVQKMKTQAQMLQNRLVLPEGSEERVIFAAEKIMR